MVIQCNTVQFVNSIQLKLSQEFGLLVPQLINKIGSILFARFWSARSGCEDLQVCKWQLIVIQTSLCYTSIGSFSVSIYVKRKNSFCKDALRPFSNIRFNLSAMLYIHFRLTKHVASQSFLLVMGLPISNLHS